MSDKICGSGAEFETQNIDSKMSGSCENARDKLWPCANSGSISNQDTLLNLGVPH